MVCRRTRKKFRVPFSDAKVMNAKQRWLWNQQKRNWLELPTDVMANILHRVGPFDILENAQKVCTTWRRICKDPSMWWVIRIENSDFPCARPELQKMCMHAVDRSQGQLVDVSIVGFGDKELLLYIADRSSQLRRLEIGCCYGDMYAVWPEALKKFPLLEELSIYKTDMSKEGIEAAGCYCPLLKSLKLNQRSFRVRYDNINYEPEAYDEVAKAIGENLLKLQHLELIGSNMSNIGLKAILDGCHHLESLDLRLCLNIDLEGQLGKRCSKQIKYLKHPNDSLKGGQYNYGSDKEVCVTSPDSDFF